MNTKRLYFLDNLKWFIIWLMVIFHGAMCYMAYAREWWYVVDKSQPVFSATLFICWVDVFIMPGSLKAAIALSPAVGASPSSC